MALVLVLVLLVWGCAGLSVGRRALVQRLEQEGKRLHSEAGVWQLPGLLSASECSELTSIWAERRSAVVESAPPKISFDSRRLALGLTPLVLASSSAQTVLSHSVEHSFFFNLALQSLFVGAVLAACSALLNSNPALLASSRRTSKMIPLAVSTSKADEVSAALVRKACRLLGCSPEVLERPALTHYSSGERFDAHQDASRDVAGDGWDALGGQRLCTVIFYVNDCAAGGGATVFDELGVSVQPRQGSALVFFPADDDEAGTLDPRMLHHAEAPLEGSEKYVVQVWQRQRRVPPPLGLTDEEVLYVSSLPP